RSEKDIEPLVDEPLLERPLVDPPPGILRSCCVQPRNGMQICSGFSGYADRRLNQDIALRYRAASKRNIGRNRPKSMEHGPEALKKLNVLHECRPAWPFAANTGLI